MQESPDHVPTALLSFLKFAGALGLLVAMSADGIAVLGRHAGFPVTGSIEIFRMAIVVALSAAILLAGLLDRHATVDLVLSRVSERARDHLVRCGRAAMALAFALIATGSLWVSADLWPSRETTEILGIPLAPFRAIWCAATVCAAFYFAARTMRGRVR